MTFLDSIEKEIKRADENWGKLQKRYLTDYSLLIAQDLWHANYQIFLIISLKEYVKLNLNMDMTIKNARLLDLDIKIIHHVK